MSITCCITCSRIHYMLPNPLHAPESITCSRIHYMLPNPLHAPEFITCSRIHYMLPNPLHGITFFGIHYMHLLSLHGIYMPSQHVSCISRPAQTGTAIAPRSLTSQMLPLAMPRLMIPALALAPSLDHHQYLRPTLTQPAQRTRGQRHQRSLSRR